MAKLCPNLKRLGTTSVGFAALSHFPGHSTRIWGKGFFQKLEQVNRASKAVLAVALASLSINFPWTPIFAWGLGAVFLSDLPDLWVGLLMLMVTPCTDWYLVFTGIAGGNVVLATALLPVNLVLQVLLLPVYLLLLAGDLVELNVEILLSGLFWILFLPLLAAALTQYSIRQIKTERGERGSLESYQDRISIMQIVALNLAIVFIFATEGSILAENPALLFKLLPPILVFFAVNFLLAYQVSRWLGLAYEEWVCLTCTTLARNSPLALAIAASAFPQRPLILLALVISPLIELPVLTIVAQMLLQIRQKRCWKQARR